MARTCRTARLVQIKSDCRCSGSLRSCHCAACLAPAMLVCSTRTHSSAAEAGIRCTLLITADASSPLPCCASQVGLSGTTPLRMPAASRVTGTRGTRKIARHTPAARLPLVACR